MKCGEDGRRGPPGVLPLHLGPPEERIPFPTPLPEMSLADAAPKDVWSVHFKGALDYVHAQSIRRGRPLKGGGCGATGGRLVCACLSESVEATMGESFS